jgi:AcrR family transcriptional regulator
MLRCASREFTRRKSWFCLEQEQSRPETRMPKKVDHASRRETFAAAAYRVIQAKGLAGATVREVAREAGFTTGALVHYVKSKDELLLAAAEYSARLIRKRMLAPERTAPGLRALREVMYLSLPLDAESRGNWNVWLGFWERATQSPDVKAMMQNRYTEWSNRLVRIIQAGQASGEFPSDIDASRAAQGAVALVDGIGVQVTLAGRRVPARHQRQLVDDWISSTFRMPSLEVA